MHACRPTKKRLGRGFAGARVRAPGGPWVTASAALTVSAWREKAAGPDLTVLHFFDSNPYASGAGSKVRPAVVVQEGGYNLDVLGGCAAGFLAAWEAPS